MTTTHASERMTRSRPKERKRMRKSLATLVPLLTVLALAVGACGGGNDNNNASGGNQKGGAAPNTGQTGKKGGTLTVLSLGDVDSLDPGYWYYQYDYMALGLPAQRELYSWKPQDNFVTPDIAVAAPQVSDGGKTLTIKIKPNIRYSPPLQNRMVKSADIKYAIERAFLPQVGNGYVGSYYTSIEGVKDYQDGKAKEISGIQTPDDTTLVLKLTAPSGVLATGVALALPATIPVPKDYAQKYDEAKQSTYGEHQVFTGPYMIPNDASGKLTGYTSGKNITLVRNPSWDAKTDFRPAYLDKVIFSGGNDITVGSRKILSGQSLLSGDFAAPPTTLLKQMVTQYKSQTSILPSQSIRFIALNTKVKPFDNINVRKAVGAVVNREALRTTRGGPAIGVVATHFIPPGMPGFDDAGGNAGPSGLDWNSKPAGDLQLAMNYMKKAGYSSGKYSGPPVLMVGDNQPPASKTGEALQAQLESLGFKLNYRQVQHPTMLSKFCGVPKAAVAICPNLGWGKDFFDSQSMIDPIFNGKNIAPVNNANYAQVDDPAFNKAMDSATQLTDAAERATAWADIDKQVTQGAYIIPWLWDNQVNFASKNVNGVVNKFNSSWDIAFTSLK
jgi:peptide/nickel transport system substrate-binding protein